MKRNCGFLTTSVAKRVKLSKNPERLINSFLMKPRDYYNYVHGTPPRHRAYTLCLAAIHGQDTLMTKRYDFVKNCAEDLLIWESIGIRLSSSFKTISRKAFLLKELDVVCHDFKHNNHYNQTILQMVMDTKWLKNYIQNL